jgi:AmmeMemoRadiSam system protein A
VGQDKESHQQLTREQQKELLSLARKTIDYYLDKKERISYSSHEEVFKEHCGAFVTLHTHGRLRGCIGIIFPIKPLYETIIDCAISAATQDYRFQPLMRQELKETEIEISVLSIPKAIGGIEEIEIGQHGLIISQGMSKGLLLPQVATEHHWDRDTFLEQTCIKAGLPRDAWKEGAKIEKFSALVFSEKDLQE